VPPTGRRSVPKARKQGYMALWFVKGRGVDGWAELPADSWQFRAVEAKAPKWARDALASYSADHEAVRDVAN